MDLETLRTTLNELTINRPWPLRLIYEFYFYLCAYLRLDPLYGPQTPPQLVVQDDLNAIQACLDLLEYMKTVARGPEDCNTIDELENLRNLIPSPLRIEYTDRLAKRQEEIELGIQETLIADFNNLQYDKEIAEFLDGKDQGPPAKEIVLNDTLPREHGFEETLSDDDIYVQWGGGETDQPIPIDNVPSVR